MKTLHYSIAPAGQFSNGQKRPDLVLSTYAPWREPIHWTGMRDEQTAVEFLRSLAREVGVRVRLVRVAPGGDA